MKENIRIDKDSYTVYLSDEMAALIKQLAKSDFLLRNHLDKITTEGIKYDDFNYFFDSIVKRCDISVKNHLENGNNSQFDKDTETKLQDLCNRYVNMRSGKEYNVINGYVYNDDITGLEQLLQLVKEIKETENKMYLIRDLINAKDDYIIDAKYFMTDEEIRQFDLEYGKAIQEKDIDKMEEMIQDLKQKNLEAWKSYTENIDNMTDENFCMIGHSTSTTNYNGEFETRFVSCSLFTQDMTDTYRSKFGFIMAPNQIVGANSEDMYVSNSALDIEDLTSYSSVIKIHHPQRIIDECKKQKAENEKNNNQQKVYSEVVIDGFEPTAIFCFTNGLKNLDPNYRKAMELMGKFPNLQVKSFDMLKAKKGKELENVKLEILSTLMKQAENNDRLVETAELSKYELFFKRFNELKQSRDYSEEDVLNLFINHKNLIETPDIEPDQLFDGSFTDEEIKYILGNNIKYNIDSMLEGKISIFSLEELEKLYNYKDKLDKYYEGLSEFVEIISKTNIDFETIQEISKESILSFPKMSEIVKKQLNHNIEKAESELNVALKNYAILKTEQEARESDEEKYMKSIHILESEPLKDLLQKDISNVNNSINNCEETEIELMKKKDKYERRKNDLINEEKLSYQDSERAIELQNRINELKEKQNNLQSHHLLNFIESAKIDNEIKQLERKYKNGEMVFNNKEKDKNAGKKAELKYLEKVLEVVDQQLQQTREKKENHQHTLEQINETMYEDFGCKTIKEVEEKIKEANEFVNNYDISNRILLTMLNRKLEEMSNKILLIEDNLEEVRDITREEVHSHQDSHRHI